MRITPASKHRHTARACVLLGALMVTSGSSAAQRPTLSKNVRDYVAIDTPTVVLTHVRVIDGTGAPPRENQTIVLRDGRIASLGDAASIESPAGAQVLDLTGKSVIPGLVMMHEHLYYPTGPQVYGNLSESFTRLYLAGGVTSMRTAGNSNGYGEINIASEIARGEKPGPWMDATAPYLQGPGLGITQMYELKNAEDARRMTELLGRRRGHVVQGVHEHHARGARGRGEGVASPRAQDHRASLLGHLSRSRSDRNRRSGAWILRRHRLRARKETGCVSRAERRDDRARSGGHERRALQVAGRLPHRAPRRGHVHAHDIRDVHTRAADAARNRRARSDSQAAVRAVPRDREQEDTSRYTSACLRRSARWR